ncbi:MAG: YaaL family protein [Agathobacter sp.]|nr:YaaL family protein [Agathobacter sp.]
MKFFKKTPEPPDGYSVLMSDIERTTAELRTAYANLENVVEPDLIDYYIYQAKAVQVRYKFLLECAKKLEGPHTKNPL